MCYCSDIYFKNIVVVSKINYSYHFKIIIKYNKTYILHLLKENMKIKRLETTPTTMKLCGCISVKSLIINFNSKI